MGQTYFSVWEYIFHIATLRFGGWKCNIHTGTQPVFDCALFTFHQDPLFWMCNIHIQAYLCIWVCSVHTKGHPCVWVSSTDMKTPLCTGWGVSRCLTHMFESSMHNMACSCASVCSIHIRHAPLFECTEFPLIQTFVFECITFILDHAVMFECTAYARGLAPVFQCAVLTLAHVSLFECTVFELGHAPLSERASLQWDQYHEPKRCPAFSFSKFIIQGGNTWSCLNDRITLDVLQISVNAYTECRV
jgi:hypothetical protein